MNELTYKLPDSLASLVKATFDDWRSSDKVRRLWQHDASLWTGTDEAQWRAGWTSPKSRSLTPPIYRGLPKK